jgi:predicted nuclease of predicted toxin-antitoxin system
VKFLFDANLSPELVRLLAGHYPGSDHVLLVGLGASPTDDAIWKHAAKNDFVIVSKDADFYRLSTLHGAPPKFVWLRVGNGPTAVAAATLLSARVRISEFLADPSAALLLLGKAR